LAFAHATERHTKETVLIGTGASAIALRKV